jgi:hypothetical protein
MSFGRPSYCRAKGVQWRQPHSSDAKDTEKCTVKQEKSCSLEGKNKKGKYNYIYENKHIIKKENKISSTIYIPDNVLTLFDKHSENWQ